MIVDVVFDFLTGVAGRFCCLVLFSAKETREIGAMENEEGIRAAETATREQEKRNMQVNDFIIVFL